MASLRRRLVVGTGIGSAAILFVAGTSVYLMVRQALLAEFDTGLRHKLQTLARIVELDDDVIEVQVDEVNMPEFQRRQRPEYYQVWSEDGSVLYRTASLQDNDLTRLPAPGEGMRIRSLALPDGRPGRVVVVSFTPRFDEPPPPGTIAPRLVAALARDTLDVSEALTTLRLVLAAVGAGAVVASLVLLRVLISVGLRPLDRLATQIEGVDERRLSARVDVAGAPRELTVVVERLNQLLARLQAAFARERTMTADVAHELRTPLGGLRTTLEVALSRDRTAPEYRQVLADCVAICVNTQEMVDQLLALARTDAGQVEARRQPVDVAALLQDAWRPFEAVAADRSMSITWEVPADLNAMIDPGQFRRVITNLLDNAVRYGNAGGDIRVSAERAGDRLNVRVANSGCRLSPDQVRHVFDRFWRGDPSRTGADSHCGLGLSLCKTIVEHFNGDICAALEPDGWFAVTISV